MARGAGAVRVDFKANTKQAQAEISKLNQHLAKSKQQGTSAAGGVGKFGGAISGLMSPLGLATVGVAGLARSIIQLGNDFDAAQSSIARATGATGKDLEQHFAAAKEVMADLPDSFESVAASYGAAATLMAGSSKESIAEMTRQSHDFARIAGGQAEQITTFLGRAGTAWQLNALEVSNAVDVMTGAAQKWGIEGGKLAKQLSTFGPVFKNMGFDIEETTVLMAAFSSTGVEARRVAPALAIFSQRVAAAGKDVREEYAKVVTAIQEAETSTEALAIATTLFGTDGSDRLVAALRSGAIPALEDLNAVVNETRVDTERAANDSATATERMAEAFNELKVAVEPAVTAIVDGMAEAATAITSAIGFVDELVGKLQIIEVPTADAMFQQFDFPGRAGEFSSFDEYNTARDEAEALAKELGVAWDVNMWEKNPGLWDARIESGRRFKAKDDARTTREQTLPSVLDTLALFNSQGLRDAKKFTITPGAGAGSGTWAPGQFGLSPADTPATSFFDALAGGSGQALAGFEAMYGGKGALPSAGSTSTSTVGAGSPFDAGLIADDLAAAEASAEQIRIEAEQWETLASHYGEERLAKAKELGLSLEDIWARYLDDVEAGRQSEIDSVFTIAETMKETAAQVVSEEMKRAAILQRMSEEDLARLLERGATIDQIWSKIESANERLLDAQIDAALDLEDIARKISDLSDNVMTKTGPGGDRTLTPGNGMQEINPNDPLFWTEEQRKANMTAHQYIKEDFIRQGGFFPNDPYQTMKPGDHEAWRSFYNAHSMRRGGPIAPSGKYARDLTPAQIAAAKEEERRNSLINQGFSEAERKYERMIRELERKLSDAASALERAAGKQDEAADKQLAANEVDPCGPAEVHVITEAGIIPRSQYRAMTRALA